MHESIVLFDLVIDTIALILALILPIFIYSIKRKFLKGEIEHILSYFMYSSFVLFLFKFMDMTTEWLFESEIIEYGAYFVFAIYVIVLFKITLMFYNFAKTYGFADLKKGKKK
ncbi:MAG: hypothetical protein PHU12_01285 [Candidatus Aenigmarchaeota archaeon]|nr:hypothetical protein [Candidatus Aenigmarchaeota archaeon]